MAGMSAIQLLNPSGGSNVARKERTRLTVYVDTPVYDRFVAEAEKEYRNLSDHINSILAEYYRQQNGAKKVAASSQKGDGS